METCVYVDGFNLYYRCLKGTPYKWLNLKELFVRALARHHQIVKIKYFTATVSATTNDPGKPARQDAYLRALRAYVPEVEVIRGHFLTHPTRMPFANYSGSGPRTVNVLKTEEKGSDVNLAVHLLNDAWRRDYACGVVVSNDSDLAEAMRLVRQETQVKVGLLSPLSRTSRVSTQLRAHAHFVRSIRASALRDSQLPTPVPRIGIAKPVDW